MSSNHSKLDAQSTPSPSGEDSLGSDEDHGFKSLSWAEEKKKHLTTLGLELLRTAKSQHHQKVAFWRFLASKTTFWWCWSMLSWTLQSLGLCCFFGSARNGLDLWPPSLQRRSLSAAAVLKFWADPECTESTPAPRTSGVVLMVLKGFLVDETNKTTAFGGS